MHFNPRLAVLLSALLIAGCASTGERSVGSQSATILSSVAREVFYIEKSMDHFGNYTTYRLYTQPHAVSVNLCLSRYYDATQETGEPRFWIDVTDNLYFFPSAPNARAPQIEADDTSARAIDVACRRAEPDDMFKYGFTIDPGSGLSPLEAAWAVTLLYQAIEAAKTEAELSFSVTCDACRSPKAALDDLTNFPLSSVSIDATLPETRYAFVYGDLMRFHFEVYIDGQGGLKTLHIGESGSVEE